MSSMQKKLHIVLTIGVLIFFLSQCTSSDNKADVRGTAFAGTAACMKCHQNITGSYIHTAHNKTSGSVTDSLLHDIIGTGKDSFAFPSETVYIDKKTNGAYQSLYRDGKPAESHRFDVYFGGRHAITFATWKNDELLQLPLSYYHGVPGWANSPGFPVEHANFDRPIVSRCFECHGSAARNDIAQEGGLSVKEKINPASVIYGIDCERCHGPAAQHVQFHTENPGVKESKYIAKWASFSRQQKLDACAVCHSGNDRQLQRSTFSFRPGDTLANFYIPFATTTATLDVHGKQTQLLMASACFKQSATMQCTTCHDPHTNSQNNLSLFSQKCMTCHQPDSDHFCKLTSVSKDILQSNCIDCHMPLQASKAIAFQKAGALQKVPYYLRTHTIAVYPEETQKVIPALKSNAIQR